MSDEEFLEQFQNCTLPLEEWTHRAHVKVAFLILRTYPFDEALIRVRQSIKAYNSSQGFEETPTSGYNETTTQAFLRLVASTMNFYSEAFPTPDADSFCDTHPHLMSRCVLRLFYSPEQRMHPAAKTTFIEPDLTALPLPHRQ